MTVSTGKYSRSSSFEIECFFCFSFSSQYAVSHGDSVNPASSDSSPSCFRAASRERAASSSRNASTSPVEPAIFVASEYSA